MAGIRFLELDLPDIGALLGWRDFTNAGLPFRLTLAAAGEDWSMRFNQGARIGLAAKMIRGRFDWARRLSVKVGARPPFKLNDAVGPIFELAVVDTDILEFQFGEVPRLRFSGEADCSLVLSEFVRFSDEAATMRQTRDGENRIETDPKKYWSGWGRGLE